MTRSGLNQDVTYWAPNGADRYGKNVFSAPVTLKGRWEDRQTEFISPTGDTQLSKSIVYLGERITVNGFLFQGISVAADPQTVSGAQQVRQSIRIPSLSSLEELTTAII